MALFFSLLPVYLLGNFHCLGMCGPLVMLLGKHRFRYLYFLGRGLSFSLAGLIAGEMGVLLQVFLKELHIPAATSLIIGLFIIWIGVHSLIGSEMKGMRQLAKWLSPVTQRLSVLLLRETPWATFLFGFFTLLLPCGQTLFVFSACALAMDPWVGLLNGAAFALLTSPSLFLALHAQSLFPAAKHSFGIVLGISALMIGTIALLRSLAEWELIPHLILNERFHLVIF